MEIIDFGPIQWSGQIVNIRMVGKEQERIQIIKMSSDNFPKNIIWKVAPCPYNNFPLRLVPSEPFAKVDDLVISW